MARKICFQKILSVDSKKALKVVTDFNASYELPFLLNAITPEYLVDNFSKNIIDSFIKRVS